MGVMITDMMRMYDVYMILLFTDEMHDMLLFWHFMLYMRMQILTNDICKM